MIKALDFDLLNSPLEGKNLIEASAGTGKTYAITGLLLRLILERKLTAKEILVVTFTEAATEELKDRIRTMLRNALAAFLTGVSDNEFLNSLVKKTDDHRNAFMRLNEAVREFDEACIYTIHGFCKKMLHENAYESGNLFDTELVSNQDKLKREIVEDFWRRDFYEASPLFVNYAIYKRTSPDNLIHDFGRKVTSLKLKIVPDFDIPDSYAEERRFKESFHEICRAWPSVKAEIEEILTTDKRLNRTSYKKAKISGWIQSMDYFVASRGNNPVLFDGFRKFCSSELEHSTKKKYSSPQHPFFYLCEIMKDRSEDLTKVYEKRLLGLKIKLFHYLQNELEKRTHRRNIQCFDDLLLGLHKALEGKGSNDLLRNIRNKFKAALIDEFQDTDPIQYAIFNKLFGTKTSILFLIGDPKQAIYGFRGADIFTYMDAAKRVKTRYTLKENWRSEPDLICAVNTIFENADRPFIYDEIPFLSSIAPPEKKDHEILEIKSGMAGAPLELWFLNAAKINGSGKLISKSVAKDKISKAVAAEISRLLHLGKIHAAILGNRPLKENDIAVLVRENSEAHIMQKALFQFKIPSVLYVTDNLFASNEALEMERVLEGIAQPENEMLLKASVSTDMFGITGEQLNALIEDETEWEKWLIKFRGYHQQWDEQGFMRMFKSLTLKENMLSRLMKFQDGERRCTNVLHLCEVLHQASVEEKLSPADLLKWLSEKRRSEAPVDEEHQLRLESDENAVRVVTIHRSKGLQYPVVFCPFAWGESRLRNPQGPFIFHDESDNLSLTLDLGSETITTNRAFAEKEMLAENLRLLYVALTRAKNRCYLVWGRFNKAETSAHAYLFHQPFTDENDNIVEAVATRFKTLDDKEFLKELETVIEKAAGAIRLSEVSEQTGVSYDAFTGEQEKLHSHDFKGKIDRQFRISSFSSLISRRDNSAEMADYDVAGELGGYDNKEFEGLIDGEEELSGIFSFPRGVKAGKFIHDILEHFDFTERDEFQMRDLVEKKLNEYGFESVWNETICRMIKNTLTVPLEPDQKGFTLSNISNKDRLNEMEFYYPLKSISRGKLKGVFEYAFGAEPVGSFPEHIGTLHFSPVSGFMKGFMDMVFQFQGKYYIVDWKSNFLGSRIIDYGREPLYRAMKRHFYVLQYHIYSIALNQYLQLRIPDYNYGKHFGGVYYIFIRGIDPDMGSDFGIYRDRPSEQLINELCAELIDI